MPLRTRDSQVYYNCLPNGVRFGTPVFLCSGNSRRHDTVGDLGNIPGRMRKNRHTGLSLSRFTQPARPFGSAAFRRIGVSVSLMVLFGNSVHSQQAFGHYRVALNLYRLLRGKSGLKAYSFRELNYTTYPTALNTYGGLVADPMRQEVPTLPPLHINAENLVPSNPKLRVRAARRIIPT